MYANELTLMAIHSRTPCNNGLSPTDLRTSTDREAPMKNMVTTSALHATPEMVLPTAGTDSRAYVLNTTAAMNHRDRKSVV